MIILISCAKTMSDKLKCDVPFSSTPLFNEQALKNALELSEFTTQDFERMLHVNTDIALRNHLRYRDFLSLEPAPIPAICAYNGAVFKNIVINDFTEEDYLYAQDHLRITSFLYGILRPLDAIKCYRLEGNIKLPENEGRNMFDFWKDKLTQNFINLINKNGGTLVYLASEEMKNLFYWKEVEKRVNIIYPEFQIMKKDKLKTIVMYAKMCRGQMARYIIKNRIEDIDPLKNFTWEGFSFCEDKSKDNHLSFIFF